MRHLQQNAAVLLSSLLLVEYSISVLKLRFFCSLFSNDSAKESLFKLIINNKGETKFTSLFIQFYQAKLRYAVARHCISFLEF